MVSPEASLRIQQLQQQQNVIINQMAQTRDPQQQQALKQQWQALSQQIIALQQPTFQQPAPQHTYVASQPATQPAYAPAQVSYIPPSPTTPLAQATSPYSRPATSPNIQSISPYSQPATQPYSPQAEVQLPPLPQIQQQVYQRPAPEPQRRDLSLEGILRDYIPIFNNYVQALARDFRAKIELTQVKQTSIREAIDEESGLILYDIWLGISVKSIMQGNQPLVNGTLLMTPSGYGDDQGVFGRLYRGTVLDRASNQIISVELYRVTKYNGENQPIESYRDDNCSWFSEF